MSLGGGGGDLLYYLSSVLPQIQDYLSHYVLSIWHHSKNTVIDILGSYATGDKVEI